MAKKKAQRKTARKTTARKKATKKSSQRQTTRKRASRKKATKKTVQRRIDLSRYSEAQLESALSNKRSAAISEIRKKRADLMRRVSELDRQIQHLGGSAAGSTGHGTRAPRGELAAAVLRELRRERTPKQLLESCSHLIGGSNKAAIIGQKLMALRDQGRVKNVKRGVWAAK